MYLGFGLFLIMNIFRFILAPYIFLSFFAMIARGQKRNLPPKLINQYFLLHWLRFGQTLLAAACCFMSLLVCSRLLKSKVALPTSCLWPTSDNEIQAHSLFSHCIRAEKMAFMVQINLDYHTHRHIFGLVNLTKYKESKIFQIFLTKSSCVQLSHFGDNE